MITALVLTLAYGERTNRKSANEIVAQLEAYTASHGKCAATLEDIGMRRAELQDKLGGGGYLCKDGKPFFYYRVSFSPYSWWVYNFGSHEWQYRED